MPDFALSARVVARLTLATTLAACTTAATPTRGPAAPQATQDPSATRSELLRGEYGRYRANNDLLYYHRKDAWKIIQPTTVEWKTMRTPLKKDAFEVATDLYFVNVTKQ